MINFFRKIRQNLLSEGKTSRYFKYAIGEILLVVIGILIALQINNWNENRQADIKKTILINALISDFEKSSNLVDSLLLNQGKRFSFSSNFIYTIYRKKEYSKLDSLKKDLFKFFNYDEYEVNLTSYINAESNGKINSLDDKNIMYMFSNFFKHHNLLVELDKQLINMFYAGPVWELSKELGSIFALINYSAYSEKEYISLLNKPIVNSCLEIINIYQLNKNYQLKDIAKVIKEIIERLYCLKENNCE